MMPLHICRFSDRGGLAKRLTGQQIMARQFRFLGERAHKCGETLPLSSTLEFRGYSSFVLGA
jgi:hypothetical protein